MARKGNQDTAQGNTHLGRSRQELRRPSNNRSLQRQQEASEMPPDLGQESKAQEQGDRQDGSKQHESHDREERDGEEKYPRGEN